MLDEARPELRACGCFFETDGGVLLHNDAAKALFEGDPIRVASPVAGGKTDDICRLILQRWAGKRGYVVEAEQVTIEEAGFAHLDNLREGFDGRLAVLRQLRGRAGAADGPERRLREDGGRRPAQLLGAGAVHLRGLPPR
jgi:hypothetical protein